MSTLTKGQRRAAKMLRSGALVLSKDGKFTIVKGESNITITREAMRAVLRETKIKLVMRPAPPVEP